MALTFRTTGMKKTTRNRIILLIVVFILSLVFFYIVLNHRTTPTISEMSKPTLPVVALSGQGGSETELFGYHEKMDAGDMTDYIFLLDQERQLAGTVNTHGATVTSIRFEIRTIDSGRMVSSDRITDYEKSGKGLTFKTQLTNLLNAGEKYELVLILKSGGDSLYYYAPIMVAAGSQQADMISFALDFHKKSLSDSYNDVSQYLETDEDGTAEKNLSHVTIRSDINDIALNGLTHEQTSDPVTKVTAIKDDTLSLNICYTISVDGQDYLATEKYRIRYGNPRMYLLTYDRTLDIIPTEGSFSVSDNVLKIGMASTDMHVMTNEAGTVAAFVQAGSLYQYNQNQHRLVTVYSFGDNMTDDERIRNSDHEIRILNVDAAGSMDFVVYGYMNCGLHEGRSGIDLYHYDSSTGIASEEGFIDSEHSLSYISSNFAELLYRTPGGRLYIMQNGRLLGIDLSSGSADVMLENLKEGQYSVSEDSRYIAWTDSAGGSSQIRVRDLASDRTFRIKAASGEKLAALCFLEDDLVYGTYRSGSDEYMYSLTIMSFRNNRMKKLKTYQKDNIYIESATSDANSVRLTRMKYENGSFKKTSADTILDTIDKSADTGVSYSTDSRLGRIRSITLSEVSDQSTRTLRYTNSRLVLTRAVISIDLYNRNRR